MAIETANAIEDCGKLANGARRTARDGLRMAEVTAEC